MSVQKRTGTGEKRRICYLLVRRSNARERDQGELVLTKDEWPAIKRLLATGWLMPNQTIDEAAYVSLLAPFSAVQVGAGVRSLLGVSKFMPKPTEIVKAVRQLAADPSREIVSNTVRGEAVLAEMKVPPPWRIDGRWFFPQVDTLLLQERRSQGGASRPVVSCAGFWDAPDGQGGGLVWGSWDTCLVASGALAEAA